MIKLNALNLLEEKEMTKYQLFNKLNNIRAVKGEKLMNYKNFLNIINQKNISVLYQDLSEMCQALTCNIDELLSFEPDEYEQNILNQKKYK